MRKATTAVEKKPDLRSLATKIRTEHGRVSTSAIDALEHAIAAGWLLLQAKKAVAHGEWLPWLKDNCHVSVRTAQVYMDLSKHAPVLLEHRKDATAAYFTLREALALSVAEKHAIRAVKIKQVAAPAVAAALESGAIDLREADRIVEEVPKDEQPRRLAAVLEQKARRKAIQRASAAQELARDIGSLLRGSNDYPYHERRDGYAQKLQALYEVADLVTVPDWLGLRNALDRLIEAALTQRARVVEALHKEVERYKANLPPPGPDDDPLSGDELEQALSEMISDEGPRRFIGLVNDYVALMKIVDASPVETTAAPAPAQ